MAETQPVFDAYIKGSFVFIKSPDGFICYHKSINQVTSEGKTESEALSEWQRLMNFFIECEIEISENEK